jgi:predicted TIM-barrel fold metal-dependent hydrolase
MSKIIDIQTHVQSREYIKEAQKFEGYPRIETDAQGHFMWFASPTRFEQRSDLVMIRLGDVEARLQDMNKAGVDVQVLSPTVPNCESFPKDLGIKLARINNDYISRLVREHPDRFVGLGSLSLQDTDASLEELERVQTLGLKGIMAHSNVGGEHLDAKKFWPVYERIARLHFPIFVHPTTPLNADMYAPYHMWGASFGFGVDTSLCAVRMILSGIFQEYPNLRIILGHLGETIPFFLRRIDYVYDFHPEEFPAIKKRPSEYFINNFYVDTAGVRHEPALRCAYDSLPHDRVVFGSDYPYGGGNTLEEVNFVRRSGLPDEDKKKIYWKNAHDLLDY